MPNTLRILKTTRERWSENLADETIDRHPMLKLLQSEGNIETDSSGTDFAWTVKNRERTLMPYGDMDDLNFARNDLYEKAVLDSRAYKLTEAVSEKEMLQNKGKEAIIKLFGNLAEDMKKEAGNALCKEFYIDGNASGNSKRFHGIESFMSITGQTASDEYGTTHNDTYAGISTARGQNSTVAGQPGYDFWTPVVVNCTTTGKTWAANADQFVTAMVTGLNRSTMKGERCDLIQLRRDSYRAFCELLRTKERVMVTQAGVGIRKFGFEDTVNYDGVDVTFDPDIPSTDGASKVVHGYAYTVSKMKLMVLGKSLWHASGDDFDVKKQSFIWWVGLHGNLKFVSPRHFGKFVEQS